MIDKNTSLEMLKYSLFITPVTVAMSSTSAFAESSGGLPQLDSSSYSSQIFWLFVSFILLYLIFSLIALPRVSRVLENRRRKINGDLEAAKTMREESDAIRDEYERRLNETRQQISDMMSQSTVAMSQKTTEQNDALSKTLMAQTLKAEKDIAAAKTKAMSDIQEAATIIAIEIANKLGTGAVNDNEAAEQVKKTVKTV